LILRRYGNKVASVTPNFDSRAMTEIGFVRDGSASMSTDEFESRYERVEGHELRADATGDVQGVVEERLLADLQRQLTELSASLPAGSALLIENESGVDHPKTRGRQTTTVVGTENRLVFDFTIDPPLRVGVYRPR
jgi:hypothetical protein